MIFEIISRVLVVFLFIAMDIKTSTPSYSIAVMGDHCINCEGYIQYYIRKEDGKYSIHTAVDRGYCIERQRITRPGNRCKHYQEREIAKETV